MTKHRPRKKPSHLETKGIKELELWYSFPIDGPADYYLNCEIKKILVRKSRKWRKQFGVNHRKRYSWLKHRREWKNRNKQREIKVDYKLSEIEHVEWYDQHFAPTYSYEKVYLPICSNCRNDLSPTNKYCPNCGCKLVWVEAPPIPIEYTDKYREEQEKMRMVVLDALKELNEIDEGEEE